MPTTFGIIKGALRSYSDGENIHALLELKSLIERERDCWTAYLVKGKVNAALCRDYDAIADFNLVLEMSPNLNDRHRRHVIGCMALCANRLAGKQKAELVRYFKKGPPAITKKRALGARVIDSPNTGRIAQVSKFLLDRFDIEKIENLARNQGNGVKYVQVLSEQTGLGFLSLLQKIDRFSGVVGSCIIGRDLFVRANSLPEDYDVDSFAINALMVFLSAKENDRLIEFYKGGQVLVRCHLGLMMMLEFDGLVLITLSNEKDILKVVKLADRIARQIR